MESDTNSYRSEFVPVLRNQRNYPLSLLFIGTLPLSMKTVQIKANFQGHPMDLFLKISVLQAHFCWLGDVEEIIVLGRKVLLEKDNSACQRGFEV